MPDAVLLGFLAAYGDILDQEYDGLPLIASLSFVNILTEISDIKQMEASISRPFLDSSSTQGPPVFRGTEPLGLRIAGRDNNCDLFKWATDHPVAWSADLTTVADTRYAYAVTEKNLVLCQFYHFPGTPEKVGKRRKVVSLESSRTDGNGTSVLNPGLALWAVVMMAKNERHRAIVSLHNMVRLSTWEFVHGFGDETCPPPKSLYLETCIREGK
ncbi:hypothetical protein B0T11DRAFT_313559 [Plectosphaerella cucumerina]|uniref:Uncharacterized protein n=1 Tax=Plectosphaerella cucumerina TaxID=40658 RepID=A0A8K0TQW3_9PEZI|nr:hypothetical protein B0T11DRAFT_313559 [Plectosphaerella cucumerina]